MPAEAADYLAGDVKGGEIEAEESDQGYAEDEPFVKRFCDDVADDIRRRKTDSPIQCGIGDLR